jgi:Carboxypeptidase regulatory-like domain
MKNYILVFVLILTLAAGTLAERATAEQKGSLPLPDSGNVTLPLDEYNRLVELASKPTKKPERPPVNYSIKRADLKLRVENESVLGSVQLEGEVFKKGVAKVPLTSGITILDAKQENKPLPLQQENGIQTAILTGPSEFSITLNAGLPLRIEAGRASLSLPVPAAGSVQLSLVLPGENTYANISPGLITDRRSENGHTSIEATLVPGESASIWWARREAAGPAVPREVRFLSEVKTLVSVSESELRIASLADVSVVQGEPAQFEVEIPEGYEVTGVTGASLESSETQPGVLILKIHAASQRGHQFLISMERTISDSKASAPFPTFKNAQRETGEVLVEGAGTMELTATEGGGLKRMDVRETNPYLRSLAHYPPQAAFRFHRQPNETPTLALEWTRFPDSSVLAAVAENAVVTTLVTSEGRSLTEVKLTVKNQAQPFLKVALPAGASILSADVAGEKVKPVQGPDGDRVPLLRPGFRPNSAYEISFVFMHSGAPFAKKGGSELSLPSMDVPINLLQWEVFLPEQYKVRDFGGDVMSANLVPPALQEGASVREMGAVGVGVGTGGGTGGGVFRASAGANVAVSPGQLGGLVVDPTGAAISGAQVTVTNSDSGFAASTVTDPSGRWLISNFPAGRAKITADARGFKTTAEQIDYDAGRGAEYPITLGLGAAAETVEVTAESVNGQISNLAVSGRNYAQLQQLEANAKKQEQNAASANVMNLQRRVAGVLPVAVEVPRTGTSFQFVRPLVLNEETKVTFSYKSK